MRVGISWDLAGAGAGVDVPTAWNLVAAEAANADRLGYDSIWVPETREVGGGHTPAGGGGAAHPTPPGGPPPPPRGGSPPPPPATAGCPAPAVMLTYLARRTRTVGLRVAGRTVAGANPVRLAEDVAVLDVFSRGRAGVAFAAASAQGTAPGHVHEVVDFCQSAWGADEFRYRGEFVRFPADVPADAPAGASEPSPARGPYVPQWERGPAVPEHLSITPKPLAPQPPVCVDVTDDATLEWAAARGVGAWLGADVAADDAVARLSRYRDVAAAAGRSRGAAEVVLERDLAFAPGGGTDLVAELRDLKARAGVTHLVWRRSGDRPGGDLWVFAQQVQPLLQA